MAGAFWSTSNADAPFATGDPGGSAAVDSGGNSELREHPFFKSVPWAKLLDNELTSPLEEFAREQLARRMEDVDWEEPELLPWEPGHHDEEVFLPPL